MTSEKLKQLMDRRKISQTDIANDLEVSKTAVHYVVSGRSVSRRIEECLAEKLGTSRADIFPVTPF